MVIQNSAIFRSDKRTRFYPIYTFSLAGNKVVYTPSQGTIREMYFNHINYKDKRCQLWQEIKTFPSIHSLISCVFSIFRQKKYESNPSEMENKVLFPAPTFYILL